MHFMVREWTACVHSSRGNLLVYEVLIPSLSLFSFAFLVFSPNSFDKSSKKREILEY
jgi:hypothetical protein